jgi:hypothetical protein
VVGRLGNDGKLAAAISEESRRQKESITPFPALFGISVVFGFAGDHRLRPDDRQKRSETESVGGPGRGRVCARPAADRQQGWL